MDKRRVILIHTGGTLGMGPGADAGALAPGPSLHRILEQVPELEQLADLGLVVACNRDSATMEPEHILGLAGMIREQAACDGFVLVHGTDTMAYTASVLGFLLADLGRPVVLTGAQRPLAYIRSDARGNLVDAVTLAGRGVAEVGICFGDHWLRGVAAEKVSVHRYEAFESPNLPPLAELGLHVQIHPHAGSFPRRVPAEVGAAIESAIQVYTPFPGMPWRLPAPGTRGVLIQSFGAGNLPMGRPDLLALFAHCADRGPHQPVPHRRGGPGHLRAGLRGPRPGGHLRRPPHPLGGAGQAGPGAGRRRRRRGGAARLRLLLGRGAAVAATMDFY